MTEALWALAAAVALSVACGPSFIRWAASAGGQPVRAEGPKGHQQKAGTPTMGGLLFIAVAGLVSLVFSGGDPLVLAAVAITAGFAAMGFADDIAKVRRGHSLGLRARTKLGVGLLLATALAYAAVGPLDLGTYIRLPFARGMVELPFWAFVALVNLVVIGTTNAVNLTDGLDGLAGGLSVLALGFFSALAFADGAMGLGLFALVLAGAVAGFLFFNIHPARVIMGDTGSLGIGAALAAMSVLTRSELVLPVVGGVFVVETLSVMIQVLAFRLWHRRVFRMSPLHHHFELLGWTETRVTGRFWLAGLLFASLGYILWW